ncbi:hypothetical protein EVAR_78981_1 [Eumeta japonica]|uniref:Uncharacterized protein n=1 Tax=Eumeta variegata TaxID=151549 RepID=A0A4C1UTC8_EUMVA|nr:hypothetical protein EVAR_78981_1 [Eumeta japonica]
MKVFRKRFVSKTEPVIDVDCKGRRSSRHERVGHRGPRPWEDIDRVTRAYPRAAPRPPRLDLCRFSLSVGIVRSMHVNPGTVYEWHRRECRSGRFTAPAARAPAPPRAPRACLHSIFTFIGVQPAD